jgi:hypothetical protein
MPFIRVGSTIKVEKLFATSLKSKVRKKTINTLRMMVYWLNKICLDSSNFPI